MTRLIAIDPGTYESAYVIGESYRCSLEIENSGKLENGQLLGAVNYRNLRAVDLLAIEIIEARGMPVGNETLTTQLWAGRFIGAFGGTFRTIRRSEVQSFLCGSRKANDSNIRQAIIDLYGGKTVAIGKKANQGPLYGLKADIWSALGVALTALGTKGDA